MRNPTATLDAITVFLASFLISAMAYVPLTKVTRQAAAWSILLCVTLWSMYAVYQVSGLNKHTDDDSDDEGDDPWI